MNKTDIERQISSIANIVRMRAEVHRNIEAFGVPICRCIDPSCFSYTSKGTLRPILVMSSVKWAVLLKHRYEILSMISKGGGIAMLEKGFYVRGFNRSTNEYSKKVFYEVSKLSGGRHNLNLIVEDKALQEVMESADVPLPKRTPLLVRVVRPVPP